mgnify:CR=1 FL=1
MTMTVELSMYPFRDDFKPPIKAAVARLQSEPDLQVTPGPTSTVIVGDDTRILECLRDLFAWSHDQHGRAVFVAKFIPGYDGE